MDGARARGGLPGGGRPHGRKMAQGRSSGRKAERALRKAWRRRSAGSQCLPPATGHAAQGARPGRPPMASGHCAPDGQKRDSFRCLHRGSRTESQSRPARVRLHGRDGDAPVFRLQWASRATHEPVGGSDPASARKSPRPAPGSADTVRHARNGHTASTHICSCLYSCLRLPRMGWRSTWSKTSPHTRA